ncbi:hypothetical protein [Streptomyces albicerus]|nr:hypothetical protein [Streptomyces albicerus]
MHDTNFACSDRQWAYRRISCTSDAVTYTRRGLFQAPPAVAAPLDARLT